MGDDVVRIGIQPEILDVDTTSISRDLKSSISSLTSMVTELLGNVDTSKMTKSLESAINKVMSAYKSASKDADAFVHKIESVQEATKQYQEFENELDNIQQQMAALDKQYGNGEDYYRNILNVAGDEKKFRDFMGLTQTKDGLYTGKERAGIHKLVQEAREYIQKLEELRQQEQNTKESMHQLGLQISSVEGDMNNALFSIDKYANAINGLSAEILGLNDEQRGFSTISNILSNISKVAKQTFSTMKAVISRVIKAVSTLYGKLKKVFGSFSSGNKGLNFDSKRLFKTFLQFGLGVRSLYFLIRKLRTELMNGMKELAKEFPEINADISSLAKAFYQLKGSIVTMIQPVASYVIPILVRLMNVLSAVMQRIAEFIAVLTGQNVIYKAVANNVDYADSIDDVGSAAKDANKQLAEYDNLLVIPQDAGSSSGSGSNSSDVDYTFEQTDIASAVSDFAKKLKDAWNDADFEGVGALIAEKLNSVIQVVDNWITTKLKPNGTKWAERIARIGNGLFNGWDATATGKTVAKFFNAILKIINKFVTTFDWAQAGTKIGNAIVSAIKDFDATQAGKTIRNFFVGILTAGLAILQQNPGKAIGRKLGAFIKSLFKDNELPSTLGHTVGAFFRNVLQFGIEFLKTDPGSTIGSGIASFLTSLFDENKNGELGVAAGEILNNIFNLLSKTFSGIDWKELGKSLFKNINTLFDTFDTKTLTGAISSILQAVTDLIWQFFDWFLLPDSSGKTGIAKTIQACVDIIAAIIDGIPIDNILKALLSVAARIIASIPPIAVYLVSGILKIFAHIANEAFPGIADGIIDMANDLVYLGDEMVNQIVDPLVEGFDTIIGIEDKTAKNTTKTVEKINSAYEDMKDSVLESLSSTNEGITEFSSNMIKNFSGVAKESLKTQNETTTNFNYLKNKTITAMTDTGTGTKSTWNDMSATVVKKSANILKESSGAFSKVKSTVTSDVKTTSTNVNSKFTTIQKDISKHSSKAKSDVTTSFDTMKSNSSKSLDIMKSTVGTTWDKIKKIFNSGGSVFDGLAEGITGLFSKIVNNIIAGINKVFSWAFGGLNDKLNSLRAVKILGTQPFKNLWKYNPISVPQIPALAQGAVIPPNKEFLAVLGDQRQGTNIEAPLDTIKQAVAEVLAEMGNTSMPEKIQIVMPNGKVLAETVWNEERKLYKQTGSYSPRFV